MNTATRQTPAASATNILELMIAAVAAGNSVIACGELTKRPTCKWEKYQIKRADEAQLKRWGDCKSYAIIQGSISGNSLVIDFETEPFYDRWRSAVGNLADGLPLMKTGGGGYHIRYRTNKVEGNQKLAWERSDEDITGRKVAIETRGEGGYAIGPGSLHPSGNYYKTISGDPFNPPVLSQAHSDALLNAARALCEAPFTRKELEKAQAAKVKNVSHRKALHGSPSVIDQFNQAHDLRSVLERFGYRSIGDRMIRPNADATSEPGVAIFKRKSDGIEVCYCWSTNDPLNDQHAHDAFSVVCELEHAGDYRKAVRAVADAIGIKSGLSKQAKPIAESSSHGESDSPAVDATAATDENGLIPLGGRDPQTNKLVLSPKRTLPTAEAYIEEFHQHAEGRTIHHYAGNLLEWNRNHYAIVEDGATNQTLQKWLHDAKRHFIHKDRRVELVPFESNPGTVKSALESIKALVHLPATTTPPVWLDKRQVPDPAELLPTPSGNLHVTTGKTYPPTPALFNINAIDFDYEENPESPEQWSKFLEQLWGDDIEQIQTLQEWLGYCLVADTRQQKMLLLVGPRRSGKGTIARVLTRLVGAGNVAGPTTSSLAGAFGLQPLIGKSLAIVSDARFTGENISVVVERLLCISGEDTLTVDRKFQTSVTMKLLTRFMFLSNELPKMIDSSGALAGRFIVLRLTRTFYGQEDTGLTATLSAELPGILLWAIEGLKRLRTRGHFIQPDSVADAIREMEDLSSPIGAFVRDWCIVRAGCAVPVADLFCAWQLWCKEQGRDHAGDRGRFGRDLRAAVPGTETRQKRTEGPTIRRYEGIDLQPIVKTAVLSEKMKESAFNGGAYVP